MTIQSNILYLSHLILFTKRFILYSQKGRTRKEKYKNPSCVVGSLEKKKRVVSSIYILAAWYSLPEII